MVIVFQKGHGFETTDHEPFGHVIDWST